MTNSPADSAFLNYMPTVTRFLGLKKLDRTSAIRLSGSPPENFDPVELVGALCKSLDGSWWSTAEARTTGNWVWHEEDSQNSNSASAPQVEIPAQAASPTKRLREVPLERMVVAEGGSGLWTYQMSTTSGFRGKWTDKRRSIDLVRRLDLNSYRFIELKTTSNDPLHAAFEILGYGLAYCLARHHGYGGTGLYNVMEASHIELEVLAPESWYEFKLRGRSERTKFDFDWLSTTINSGLKAEIRRLKLDGLNEVTFGYRSFPSGLDIRASAAAIVGASPIRPQG